MNKVSPEMERQVLALLTEKPQRARDVWHALDCWTLRSTRCALNQLAVRGEIERDVVHLYGNASTYVYRLKPSPAVPSWRDDCGEHIPSSPTETP